MSTQTRDAQLNALRREYMALWNLFKQNRVDIGPFARRLKGETNPDKVREGVTAMREFLTYRGFMENDPNVRDVPADNRPEFDLASREYVEDYLRATPERFPVNTPTPVQHKLGVTPQAGKFYMVGNTPFEVVQGRNGHLYARRRHNDTGKWEYAKGAIFAVRDNGREATVEDIAKYSLQRKQCFVCGRKLEAAKSVAKGIGPVCEKTVKNGRKQKV